MSRSASLNHDSDSDKELDNGIQLKSVKLEDNVEPSEKATMMTSEGTGDDVAVNVEETELTSLKHGATSRDVQEPEVVKNALPETEKAAAYDNAAYEIEEDEDEGKECFVDIEPEVPEVEEPPTGCAKKVDDVLSALRGFWDKHGEWATWAIYATFIAGYSGYLAYAMYYEFGSESSIRLLWMSLTAAALCAITFVRDLYGHWIYKYILRPIVDFVEKYWLICKWLFIFGILAFIVIYLIVEVAIDRPENMVSLVGYFVYVLLLFLLSAFPSKVAWRPVLWGLGLQFFFGLLVLRTVWGYEAFKWLGDRIQEFMEYTNAGAEFVFGESYTDHMFAFQVMPVVIFFSSTISILYYWGWMQAIIEKIAWVMQYTMDTTAAESTNAAGNIFIGQTEAPLLIRPMLKNMTRSELHAVMTGGYATIAGSVMATYIMFGVPANHLITASVMAAPCALGMSKLFYPEVNKSKTKSSDIANMEDSPYHNTIEAAAAGASMACSLVANIIANLIAFLALLEFLNTTLTWMGHRVGLWAPDYPELTFEMICSYLLWPFAFVMGVAVEDCRKVAELIGIKTFINEFVAYTELGKLIDNTEIFNAYNGTYEENWDSIYLVDTNTTLEGGVLQDRSIIISTYALCGFANIGSIGMVIGALGAMMTPERQPLVAQLAVRAMIAGNVVSFMNACTAGLLYDDYDSY